MLMNWKNILLQLLYPARCPGCGMAVARHGQWCPKCFAAIWHPRRLNRSKAVTALDCCYSLTDYRGDVRRVLHRIKYDKALRYEESCRYLLGQFPWPARLAPVDCVVPVPLSPEKLQARGFNQTERIFRPWAERTWPWYDALQRVRPTTAQWQLRRQDRADNVRSVMEVKAGMPVAGRHILLVDVMTLGLIQNNKKCA
ncbi:MAG: double zinc ribbon domain-containing protein [Megasphaera sp.]|nr:double zinc ribbon domain-containing protein [Megasphaera sp.]